MNDPSSICAIVEIVLAEICLCPCRADLVFEVWGEVGRCLDLTVEQELDCDALVVLWRPAAAAGEGVEGDDLDHVDDAGLEFWEIGNVVLGHETVAYAQARNADRLSERGKRHLGNELESIGVTAR